jgi:hypothetical protein
MMKIIKLMLAVLFLAATTQTPSTAASLEPVQAANKAIAMTAENTEVAEFTLVNATSQWLSLFVDGQRTVTVNPGDRGVVLVSVGNHTFRAEATDGRFVQRTDYVSPAGATWTVRE